MCVRIFSVESRLELLPDAIDHYFGSGVKHRSDRDVGHTLADGATAILILAPGNPNAGVVTFEFSALSGERSAATRIRLAKTQDVVAIARMEDGSFAMAKRQIKVTIGGCGG